MESPERIAALQRSYDRVAAEYAQQFFGELEHKPLDRALLACFAEQVRGSGTVADVGCGPGQIARYLHDRGLPVVGLDLSAGMVALAQRLTREVDVRQGNMLDLDAPDAAWAGIVAFYSLIHLTPDEMPQALCEFHRVLQPGGMLLLAFHLGREVVHRQDWWGYPVDLDFHLYDRETVEGAVMAAGFAVTAWLDRQPYTEVEYPSRRAYLLARKPQPASNTPESG